MGHYVRILPGRTIRLPPNICPPYNADFDGDEVNVHVPQTLQAAVEVEELMNVKHNLVSTNASSSTGFIQNTLLGIYLLSRDDVFLDRDAVMELLFKTHPTRSDADVDDVGVVDLPVPALLTKSRRLWTGKQVLSLLLPASCNEDAKGVYIRRGWLVHGCLGKAQFGQGRGNVLHRIFLDESADSAVRFMRKITRVVNAYLDRRGFSVGLGDCQGTVVVPGVPDLAGARNEDERMDLLRNIRTQCQGKPVRDTG